jgi:hypothetical protein
MSKQITVDEISLELHRKHLGLYQKIADSLSVAPSYVSLVASGKSENACPWLGLT